MKFPLTAAAVLLLTALPPTVEAATTCSTKGTKQRGATGRQYTTYDTPAVNYGPNGGWSSLPGGNKVCGARLHRDLKIPGANQQLTIPLYESDFSDTSAVQRIVIGSEAKGRDPWRYWTSLNNAKQKAYADNAFISSSKQTAILVPKFLSLDDRRDGAATETDLLFPGNKWADGFNANNPKKLGAEAVSSFDVLDALVNYATKRYPNAKRIVFAGHSMGAQLVQRYAALRKDGQRDMHFAPMNPGSYVYFNHSRINWNDTAKCPAYDDYKLGISQRAGADAVPPYAAADISSLGRVGLTTRITDRRVHLLVGANDHGAGDYSCEASAQGKSHRQRGQFYLQSVIQSLPANSAALRRAGGAKTLSSSKGPGEAGVPAKWSWDVVPGCSHDEVCMFNSAAGQKRLYLDGFPRSAGKRDADEDVEERDLQEDEDSVELQARAFGKPHLHAVHAA
ncbi:hypothetical protein V8E36_001642 [Tilletia maclaganii]